MYYLNAHRFDNYSELFMNLRFLFMTCILRYSFGFVKTIISFNPAPNFVHVNLFVCFKTIEINHILLYVFVHVMSVCWFQDHFNFLPYSNFIYKITTEAYCLVSMVNNIISCHISSFFFFLLQSRLYIFTG